MRPFLALVVAAAVVSAGCWSGDDNAANTSGESAAENASEELQGAVTASGLRAHLVALQRIAAQNDGTRASGTPGYDDSVDYVVSELRRAGYEPRVQRFVFTASQELAPPELARISPDPVAYVEATDFVPLRYSGSGDVEAIVQPVDAGSLSSGCEPSDFAEFDSGSVALIRRGGCFFVVKVGNAVSAGAAAVLVFNDGGPGHETPLEATLLRPAEVPALSLANDLGEELAERAAEAPVRVHVATSFQAVQRETANVLADLPGSQDEAPVLLGAHLDSIVSGPGINDNGSGVATLLEIASQARRLGIRPQRPVRFAFWAAEEVGLVGSTKYVESLGGDADRKIAAVVNFDVLGSPNAEPFVYDADATIEDALTEAVRDEGLEPIPIELEGRSDHAPFAEAGIPVGGLFTGADEPGPGGRPHDACYHRPCDTLENVDFGTLEQMADAVALAVFGRLTSSL
jgi:Zn-dependent M28 family amino/carboxypeptidase